MDRVPMGGLVEAIVRSFRLKLARWILGKHCVCYQTGYHKLCDFTQRVKK